MLKRIELIDLRVDFGPKQIQYDSPGYTEDGES